MRESHLGTAVSVLVHSCVILLLVAASFTAQEGPVKEVEIDFSLMKDPAMGSAAKVEKERFEKKTRILHGDTAPKRIVEPDRPLKQNPETLPAKEWVEPPPVPTIVTASDAQGEMVIHGTPANYAGPSRSGLFLQAHGGSTGATDGAESGGQGAGKGGEIMLAQGKDYNYIRDAVMKNIEYPERARRRGLEGKTLLSFIVLENGTTSEIRALKSSGYRILDDNAKEGVARTVISRKMPYRVIVHLPITYKLQALKDGGI